MNDTLTNTLQANTIVNAPTLNVTGTAFANNIQANTRVNTSTLTVTNSSFVNVLNANTNISTPIASVSGTVFTGNLVANTFAQIQSLNVIGNAFADTVNANTSVYAPVINASGTSYANVLRANSLTQTQTLNVIGTEYVDTISANTTISTPRISVSTLVDANNAPAYFSSVTTTGTVTVGGNFVINGSTVYSSNTFILGTGSPNQFAYFGAYRTSGVGNSYIRWNETQKYWDTNDVSTGTYYRILTNQYISDSVSSTSTSNVASSFAANTLNNSINTANTFLQSNTGTALATAKAYTDTANTWLTNNINAVNTYTSSAYNKANTSFSTIVGTTGSASQNSSSMTFTSTNGLTISGTSNTLTFNTAQDIRSTASPSFAGLTLTAALPLTSGGTGATSAAQALTNILPTGTTAGYVLTTGGPGTFYWAASAGGGGGATPGTTINSSRLFPTVNAGQTLFTTPTYTPGASQLRVYINGVRQFNSEYTETSNASVTLTSGCTSGDVVMLEVDGYINNPYYANTIAFTAPFGGIVATANTIQLAIQDLETRKATLASPAFTGIATATTPSTNTSNTQIATTLFVQNQLNNGNTYTMGITGNAGTVTNGVYTNGSYSNPSWITSIANTKISGVITNSQLANSSITVTAGSGLSGGGSVSLGGSVTLTNAGVTSLTGTTNNVTVSASTGSVTVSLPSSINIASSLGVGTNASGVSGEIVATGQITANYSDDNLKTRLGNIENALDKVVQLNGFYYEPNEVAQELGYKVKREVGVSAQEVNNVLPEIVAPAPIDDKYLTIHYERLIPLLIESIKELKMEIDTLKNK